METPSRLIRHQGKFPYGTTSITSLHEEDPFVDTGMEFSITVLPRGETTEIGGELETAMLLLGGEAEVKIGSLSVTIRRHSLFYDDPSCIHLPKGKTAQVFPLTDCEFACFRVENTKQFNPKVFLPQDMVEVEDRDKGKWDNTAWRIVKTIFDLRNRPNSMLVLGEVVALPGRWSSYPPHHHPQPEIYHYRFSAPQGYGHAELGEDVFKVRSGDTLLILDSLDHSQVAAPGYAMYYIFAIRHLEGKPYITPEFTKEHLWLKEKDAKIPQIRRYDP